MSAADRELLDRTMNPYRTKRAIYLESAQVGQSDGRLIAEGSFSIDEPCYIDDTGHFNAVESIICYNQLMYFVLASAVRDRAIDALSHWDLADYWQHQLPDVLIYRQSFRYRRPIGSQGFTGQFQIVDIDESSLSRDMLKLATTISFSDPSGGSCDGAVDLTLVNIGHRDYVGVAR